MRTWNRPSSNGMPGRARSGLCLFLVLLTTLVAPAPCVQAHGLPAMSDAALLKVAASPFDKAAMLKRRVIVLGQNHGFPVAASFRCVDLCPQNTVRVIHYDMLLSRCAEVHGVERVLQMSPGSAQERFCVPQVLADQAPFLRGE